MRSSLACVLTAISPISSRKIVPWCGRLELADLLLGGAGERAFFVAEQLALQQRLGDGGTVEADERPLAARAGEMDGAGDQLLARPAIAADQHRGVGRRDPADLLVDACNGGAVADQLALDVE